MKTIKIRNFKHITGLLTIAILLVFGIALLDDSFAAEKPKYGGTLRIVGKNIKQFDPAQTASMNTQFMISFFYDALITGDLEKMQKEGKLPGAVSTYTPNKYLKGALAERWEWLDSTTLVFYLRKGVKFQNKPPVNGREFVADDVVYSFKRYFSSKKVDHYIHDHIESVVAKDKYTVVFKLKEPYSQALLHIGMDNSWIFPHEVVEKYEDLSNWENAVGTGPFLLKNFSSGNSLTFQRNPDYRDKEKIYVDKIKASIIRDRETRLAAFRTGKVDILYGVKSSKMAGLKKSNPELKYRKLLFFPVVIYMRTDKKPFSDIRVRKAIAMAIDRKAIVKRYWGGDAEIYAHPYPPTWGEELFTPLDKLGEAAENFSYNPEKAKQLLKAAGYPNGLKTKLTYTMAYGRAYAEQMELVKAYLSQIGVDLELNLKEYMAYYTTAHKGKYEGMGAGLLDAQPLASTRYYVPGSTWNKSHVNDPKMIEMAMQLKAATGDRSKFNAIAKKTMKYAIGQTWDIPMPSPYVYMIWQPWVKNFAGLETATGLDQGHTFEGVWIDQALKKKMLK